MDSTAPVDVVLSFDMEQEMGEGDTELEAGGRKHARDIFFSHLEHSQKGVGTHPHRAGW